MLAVEFAAREKKGLEMKIGVKVLFLLVVFYTGFLPGQGYGQEATDGEAGVTDGLVAYWNFDGHIQDVSGGGNHGLWNGEKENAPSENFVDGVPGSGRRALKFDGEEGSLIHGEIVFDISESHSVSLWHWIPWGLPSGWNALFGSNGWGNGGYWLYHIESLVKYQDYFEQSTHMFRFSPRIGRDVFPGEWVHLAIVTSPADADAGLVNYKIYINGSLEQEAGHEWSARPVTQFKYEQIGGRGGRIFTGKLDDFRIYDRELTEEEINKLYNLWTAE